MRRTHRFEQWLVPLLIICFCVAAFAITTTFEQMPPILKRGIQPSDFPQLVAGLIILLSALMAWRDPIGVTDRIERTTWATLGFMALFVAVAAIDLFLGLGVFAAGLSALWGERRVRNLALVGVAVPFAVFLLFDFVFEIRFPRGLLTNLWYG